MIMSSTIIGVVAFIRMTNKSIDLILAMTLINLVSITTSRTNQDMNAPSVTGSAAIISSDPGPTTTITEVIIRCKNAEVTSKLAHHLGIRGTATAALSTSTIDHATISRIMITVTEVGALAVKPGRHPGIDPGQDLALRRSASRTTTSTMGTIIRASAETRIANKISNSRRARASLARIGRQKLCRALISRRLKRVQATVRISSTTISNRRTSGSPRATTTTRTIPTIRAADPKQGRVISVRSTESNRRTSRGTTRRRGAHRADATRAAVARMKATSNAKGNHPRAPSATRGITSRVTKNIHSVSKWPVRRLLAHR